MSKLNVKNLYHLSIKNDLILMTPRIPKTAHEREEVDTPRICFSKSIRGCILAINHHIELEFLSDALKILTLYVYKPRFQTRLYGNPNSEIIRKKLVHDAHITEEVWIEEPVVVECVGKIHIKNEIEENVYYNFFNKWTEDSDDSIVYKHSEILPL